MARSNLSTEARVDAALACNTIACDLHEVRMHHEASIAWQLVAMLRNPFVDRPRAEHLLDKLLGLSVPEAWSVAQVRVLVGRAKEALGLPRDEISSRALDADRSDDRDAFKDFVASIRQTLPVAIEIPIGRPVSVE